MISGRREAELIFGAIRASVLLEPAPALCFDLGGGSLEIMVGDAGGIQWATSKNLGVGRLTAELVTSDPLSKDDRRRLRARLVDELTPIAAIVAPLGPKLLVGSSGTLDDLARMVVARRPGEKPGSLNQVSFTRDEFLPLHKDLLASTADERLRLNGLEARRVDLIVAGSVFLETAMDLFGFDALTISEWALREGIVLDAIRRHDPPTGPTTLARSAGRQCKVSRAGATGTKVTRGRLPSSRLGSSIAHKSCTVSGLTTASCSSTPRCCTTSASTSLRPAITSTASTSSRTAGCAGSHRPMYSCSRRSHAGTTAARHRPSRTIPRSTATASAD